jgi:glutamate N-acetyltransferase/amino-acid N-acetyltransferase
MENSPKPLPIAGVTLSTVCAGIRKSGHPDLTLIQIAPDASVAAVFTQNLFCAAPVTLARQHLITHAPRLLVINSGNANAGTGAQGMADARSVCHAAGEGLGCSSEHVLPFSTGVIGQRLPAEKITAALDAALANLQEDAWAAAAVGIMTTDTVPKCVSREVNVGGQRYRITGIAKGAGMIKPNMATLLAFIATDARINAPDLNTLVAELAERTFNRITIDGDTSTNDSCVLIATGQACAHPLLPHTADWRAFTTALEQVFADLARAVIRDGEGATKLVTVAVRGGQTTADCLRAAYAVAESPLVKTALFASDPNWGRILAAVGRSGAQGMRLEDIAIAIGNVPIVARGEPVPGYVEADVARVMQGAEYEIAVQIGTSETQAAVLTCDFSFEYVRINAEYRS